MKEKKSLLIFNDNSEFKTYKKIMQYNKDILKTNILLIDRRQKEDFFKTNNNIDTEEHDILRFNTSQKWSEFLLSAMKASEYILRSFEIDSLFIFYQYDPLAAILVNTISNLDLNIILQRPELEEEMDTKHLFATIKGYVKTFSFFLLTKKRCFFEYRESIHNFLLPQNMTVNLIRMYPNKINNLFKFGKIIINNISNVDNLVFICSDNYIHPSVNFDKYLNDSINFLKKNNIQHISFHPRESILFKNSIRDNLPEINTYDGFNFEDYPFKPVPVSVSSQVCFDLLIDGHTVIFVPDCFPSTFSALLISLLRNYLRELPLSVKK